MEPGAEGAYRRSFARLLPRALFRALPDVDHYWTRSYARANEEAFAWFTSPCAAWDPAAVEERGLAPGFGLNATPASIGTSSPTT